ncbi:MAG: 50S ribosomal protein L24 [Dehalococcoidia bacterium]|nr:50S ribosomal protein L24 [Dehalococcoidia bacterium]
MSAKIRKNDIVMVLAGKDRGRQGKVKEVLPSAGRVLIEGINIVKRHSKPRSAMQQGGILEIEASIHLSNVSFICNTCGKSTRIGFKTLDNGTKVRFCKKCREVVD